jgi:hydroxymethyl cephem carbamoyltransferase
MLILGLNPGHDGAIAAIKDRELLFSFEAEKGSYPRHSMTTVTTLFDAVRHLDETPDVIGYCGDIKKVGIEGVGYLGQQTEQESMNFMGQTVTLFSTTHERSHIASSFGMGPGDDSPQRVALVWEGGIGSFYLVDAQWKVTREIQVMWCPGVRYAALFAVADYTFPAVWGWPRLDDAGKLMALAAYGDASAADSAVVDLVDRLLTMPAPWPFHKADEFLDSPLYNAGFEAEITKTAAALLTQRIFQMFADAAQEHLPPGLPLYISGGCGLNCEWNIGWRELGYFSSVFVPPCTNDSGLAIGAAADALLHYTGEPYIDWTVYGGRDFDFDRSPDPDIWKQRRLDERELADALASGRVVAWVQGRAEIGPRALGNRSLLAEPFQDRTRDRLNEIKKREAYRPIAPVCRIEDVGSLFDRDFADPYMLYFRHAVTDRLRAVTHVDGTARCQTVDREANPALHDLLTAFADRHGAGVLCNTSLNFRKLGFINRMSDLVKYCQDQGVDDFVVGNDWYKRIAADKPTPVRAVAAAS